MGNLNILLTCENDLLSLSLKIAIDIAAHAFSEETFASLAKSLAFAMAHPS